MPHTEHPQTPQERKAFDRPGERKSASTHGELQSAMGEFLTAFEHFKAANDERLSQLERRGSPDVLTSEKVDRVNDAVTHLKGRMDMIAAALARPGLSGEGHGVDAERRAFREFLRKGTSGGAAEMKALSGTPATEGAYLLPTEVERMIDRALPKISPIRSIASVRQIGTQSFKKPFATAGAEVGWVGETADRPETDPPTLAELVFPTAELYAMPAATLALLDDAAADVETWLAEEIQTVFAEEEGKAFVSGNGTAKPKGFIAYTTVADASWTPDKIGFVLSGADGAFAAEDPGDALLNLVYAPRQGYRANAHWVMNRKTEAAVRKFKDGEGNYLWRPGTEGQGAATLLGYPVVESEDMPDLTEDSLSIAFGDFRRGYLIVDRVGIRILRDPYSAKPYVRFYATKRVGGGVQDFAAIKLMKFAAS